MADTGRSVDLDLSKVEDSDVETLADEIESYYAHESTQKLSLAYIWERNHLFLDGQQWLQKTSYDKTGRLWEPVKVHQDNEYIPRPVTNYMYDAYQTLKSYMIQHRPRSKVQPNDSQSYEDKQAAKIAEIVAECNWERLKEEYNYEYAAATGILYGTVFKKSFWDTSALQMAEVPVMAEQPVTDPMTGEVLGYETKEVRDPETNEVVTERIPLGDVNTSVIEPYRMAVDPLASNLHNLRWIMEYEIMPIPTIQELYGKEEPGFTGLAAELKPETMLNNGLRRFYELKISSGFGTSRFANSDGTAGSEMIENAAVVKTYYSAPTMLHPEGRCIIVANKKTLYAGPSKCYGTEQGDWHPYSEFRWEVVPGRFWGKGALDDVIEPQKRLNSIDSAIILTRKTMAVPQKLIPKKAGMAKGEWTGTPGQELHYNPVDGQKPETIQAAGVDPQVWREREQCVEDIQRISGAIDILKGDRPPGVTAASALELLFEVGTGKIRPALDRWKYFIENDQKKQLKLVSKNFREPRPDFIALLKKNLRDLPMEAVESFIGADLRDNCNLIIEAGANVPKLESAKKARIMEAANAGALQLEVPENRMRFLEDLGISGYNQNVSPDVKRAEWENDLIDRANPSRPAVVLMVDNHEIHMEVHARRQKQPSFMDLPIDIQQAHLAHYEEHKAIVEQQELEMAMKVMTGQASPQPPKPGLNQNSPTKSEGKGAPTQMKNAMMGADIPPAIAVGS